MLTDKEILENIKLGDIKIDPFNPNNLEAGRLNVFLGRFILEPIRSDTPVDPTDPETQPKYKRVDLRKGTYILKPKQFILGQTIEKIGLDKDIGMLLDGSSTNARLGITIHQSAMFIPPAQDKHIITLEIFNAGIWDIRLSYKMKIGKLICFKFKRDNKHQTRRNNQYNGQEETTGAIFED